MAGMDREHRKWLEALLGDCVRFDEPMSRHTSFKLGGPADAFAAPGDIGALVELVRGIRERDLPCLVIGGGTNLLVRDGGIRGVTVVLKSASKSVAYDRKEGIAVAGAGAGLNALCGFCLRLGLSGMNFALGIPGTVGGAVVMNAGTALGQMQDVLKRIEVLLADGRTKVVERGALDFSYRKLGWGRGLSGEKDLSPVVTKAVFALRPEDPETVKKQAQEIIRRRRVKQPGWAPSAGCFFKNPVGERPAGMLIELAGLKGKSVGGAAVSEKHANFLVNRENASAKDVLRLKELVQETVKKKFDIDLEPEVKIVGE